MEYKVIDGKGVIPDGATDVGEGAFKNCVGLQSVVIPDGVTKIWSSAFAGCTSIKSIVIPNCVTKIGDWRLGILLLSQSTIGSYHNSRERS